MFHKIPKEQNLIVILDDDKDVQFSLDSLLRSVGFTTLIFSSTDEFLTTPLPPQACCMLLDVKLGNVNGLDFLEEMAQRGLTLPVIIITGHGDIPMAVRGIKSGATDFLSKPYKDTVLLNAIADSLEKWRNNQESQEKKKQATDYYATLSQREKEVMECIISGLMNKQIADRLGISLITVKIHRAHIMKKMHAQSLADLVRMSEYLNLHNKEISRYKNK